MLGVGFLAGFLLDNYMVARSASYLLLFPLTNIPIHLPHHITERHHARTRPLIKDIHIPIPPLTGRQNLTPVVIILYEEHGFFLLVAFLFAVEASGAAGGGVLGGVYFFHYYLVVVL